MCCSQKSRLTSGYPLSDSSIIRCKQAGATSVTSPPLTLHLFAFVYSADARMLILRSLNLPPETPDTHDKVRFLLPPMRERVKQKAKEILIDDELRRRRTNKMQMIAEGAEAQRIETAQMERKRKQEEKAQWEGGS